MSNPNIWPLAKRAQTKAMQLGVLLFLGFAPQAFGQSMHKCSTNGGVWYHAGPCPIPEPHDRTIRKCVAPNGAVSIQNEPCATKAKTKWVRATEPEVVTAETLRRQAAVRHKQDADSRYLSRLAGTDRTTGGGYTSSRTSDSQRTACEQAKRHREAVLNQVGLRRTHDLLRALDEAVYRACPRGP